MMSHKRNIDGAFGPSALAVLATLALALATATSLASCAKKGAAAERPPRAVTALAAEKRDFALAGEYGARVAPSREVTLTPKVGGRVLSVAADVGSPVVQGQALLTLDPSDYAAQYRQAKAALGSAQAALTRTSDSGQQQQVLQASAAADQAKVAYDDAQSAYQRTKGLFDSGVVSRQQLDDAEARYKSAGIQLDAANNALALVKDKALTQSSDIATGQVEQATAQADLAKSQLDATVIRSPLTGRVSYRDAEVGELVGTSSLVFIVIDDRSVLVEAGLSERVVGSVRKGMSMQLVVPALGNAVLTGVVDSVSPAADPRTMQYSVKVRVANPDGALKSGMLARLRVPLETRKGAILVPERSTFSENGNDYVFVVAQAEGTGQVARKRLVTLGETDGSSVEVTSGLAQGELVVTAGQEFLDDGDRVIVSP